MSTVTKISPPVVTERYPPGLWWLGDGSGFFDPDQSGLELVLETVGVAADIQRNGMVEHPVEDRGGNQAITEALRDLPAAA